ncbi:hypothetical protein J6590_054697 [Homalodisca vitripennis]|nr:hypothetical protein J6590_054697 [Homalodisca vitripennis]
MWVMDVLLIDRQARAAVGGSLSWRIVSLPAVGCPGLAWPALPTSQLPHTPYFCLTYTATPDYPTATIHQPDTELARNNPFTEISVASGIPQLLAFRQQRAYIVVDSVLTEKRV